MTTGVFQFPVNLLPALDKSKDGTVYLAKLGKRVGATVEILTGEQGTVSITVPCAKSVKLPSAGTVLHLLPNGQLDPTVVYNNAMAAVVADVSKPRTPVIRTVEC